MSGIILFDLAQCFNLLGPCDSICHRRSWSTSIQAMAYYLTAPSYYINQCWLTISEVQGHPSEGNFTKDTSVVDLLKLAWNPFLYFFSNLPGGNELIQKWDTMSQFHWTLAKLDFQWSMPRHMAAFAKTNFTNVLPEGPIGRKLLLALEMACHLCGSKAFPNWICHSSLTQSLNELMPQLEWPTRVYFFIFK